MTFAPKAARASEGASRARVDAPTTRRPSPVDCRDAAPAPLAGWATTGLAPEPTEIAGGFEDLVEAAALTPVQRHAQVGSVVDDPARVQQAAHLGTSGAGVPLPHLDRIQPLFGAHDVSSIKAHVDTAARAGAGAMGAEAFATDGHVAFARPPSLRTAAHEAAHVVQQRSGVQLEGGVGQEGDPYEQHADAVADLVVAGRSAASALDRISAPPVSAGYEDLVAASAGPRPRPDIDPRLARLPSVSLMRSPGMVQRAIAHDAPDWDTADGGRAGSVEVHNIRGQSLPLGSNEPAVNPAGWQQLLAAYHTLAAGPQSTHYNAVRMHLWNGRLEGPGNDVRNLAPGPAHTNSSMSAGPEKAAKDAVDGGERIWLKTQVWYAAAFNAAQFSTIVPNRMKMEWGLMKNGQKGVAQPPAWDEAIEPPAEALTAADRAFFQAVPSWAALKAVLDPASQHQRLQAFFVVPAARKVDMVTTYAHLILLDDDVYTWALANLDAVGISDVIVLLQHQCSTRMLMESIVTRVSGAVLRALYDRLPIGPFTDDDFIRYRGGSLIATLGLARVGPHAKLHRDILNLLSQADQYALLDTMSAAEISFLLGGRVDHALFQAWAAASGAADAAAFIEGKVSAQMAAAFSGGWALKQAAAQQQYDASLQDADRRFTRAKLAAAPASSAAAAAPYGGSGGKGPKGPGGPGGFGGGGGGASGGVKKMDI